MSARMCGSKREFFKKFPVAFLVSWNNGWLDEFFSQMKSTEVEEQEVEDQEVTSEEMMVDSELNLNVDESASVDENKKKCAELARHCSSRSEFLHLSNNAYNMSRMNGWLDEFFGEPKKGGRRKNLKKYDKEVCRSAALKCKNRTEFFQNDPTLYNISRTNKWLDEFFGEKKNICKDHYKEVAQKYKSKSQFAKKNKTAYKYCLMHGWLDEFFPNSRKGAVKSDSIRKQILDKIESMGKHVTKKEVQHIMFDIAGQPHDRLEWGVSYLDNVSFGCSVFMPSTADKRYLKKVKKSGTGKKTKYFISEI